MAGKKPSKLPVGPHPLTLKGERNETRKQEKAESPAFEKAEKRLGIEGRYGKGMKSKKR